MSERASERRRLGRQMAVEGLLRAALAGQDRRAAQPAPQRPRRRVRPGRRSRAWIGVAAALAAAAAALLVVVRMHPTAGHSMQVLRGRITCEGRTVERLEPGRPYFAGPEGARLASDGGGSVELSAGSSFMLAKAGALELCGGELFGDDVSGAAFQAGGLRARTEPGARADLAIMCDISKTSREEAAVAVLSGRALAGLSRPDGSMEAGWVLAWGWGTGTTPQPIAELKAVLVARRAGLAPASESDRYRGIVSEYAERLAGFRQELGKLPSDGAEAEALRGRIESLADCRSAHDRRLAELEADGAERVRIDRRIDFLDRAAARISESKVAATPVSRPESPGGGWPLAFSLPEPGGTVGMRLSWLGRR